MMVLYHTTNETAATAILAGGFMDNVDEESGRAGVWFADNPTDSVLPCDVNVVLVVDVPAPMLNEFEVPVGPFETWSEEDQTWIVDHNEGPVRVFFVPASLVNEYGLPSRWQTDEQDLESAGEQGAAARRTQTLSVKKGGACGWKRFKRAGGERAGREET